MKNNNRIILVALPFKGVSIYVSEALQLIPGLKITLRETQDFYAIKTVIRETDPDIVLTTPIFLGDPLLPLFKEDLEMQGIKYVAYCTTTAELQFLKNYDAKLTLSDNSKEIAQTIEELLNSGADSENGSEDPLTAREKEVVIAVVKGLTNKEIADLLFLSTHTVITHRKNIARKLNIHSPAGLTVYAIMNKLVDLEDIGD